MHMDIATVAQVGMKSHDDVQEKSEILQPELRGWLASLQIPVAMDAQTNQYMIKNVNELV